MLLQVIKLSEAECEVVSLQRGGNTIGFAGNHKSQTKGVATSRHCPGNKSTHMEEEMWMEAHTQRTHSGMMLANGELMKSKIFVSV